MYGRDEIEIKKKIIIDLIDNQNLKPKDKKNYLNLLEDFFFQKNAKEIIKRKNLTENDILLELIIEYLKYSKKNIGIDSNSTLKDFSSFKLSEKKNSNSKNDSFKSFSSKIFKKFILNENDINIENFDRIKADFKFYIYKLEYLEKINKNKKIISLDGLLKNIQY